MTTMFAVARDDLRRTQWLDTPPVALRPGEARLRIDLFALTANNITYGAFGEAMHYWDFFPTGDTGTGCIPVWGFATVSESLADGVEGRGIGDADAAPADGGEFGGDPTRSPPGPERGRHLAERREQRVLRHPVPHAAYSYAQTIA